jgi:hypothetical protein
LCIVPMSSKVVYLAALVLTLGVLADVEYDLLRYGSKFQLDDITTFRCPSVDLPSHTQSYKVPVFEPSLKAGYIFKWAKNIETVRNRYVQLCYHHALKPVSVRCNKCDILMILR